MVYANEADLLNVAFFGVSGYLNPVYYCWGHDIFGRNESRLSYMPTHIRYEG
jgi:hypothetical protein